MKRRGISKDDFSAIARLDFWELTKACLLHHFERHWNSVDFSDAVNAQQKTRHNIAYACHSTCKKSGRKYGVRRRNTILSTKCNPSFPNNPPKTLQNPKRSPVNVTKIRPTCSFSISSWNISQMRFARLRMRSAN